jgi:hypothetical protein
MASVSAIARAARMGGKMGLVRFMVLRFANDYTAVHAGGARAPRTASVNRNRTARSGKAGFRGLAQREAEDAG